MYNSVTGQRQQKQDGGVDVNQLGQDPSKQQSAINIQTYIHTNNHSTSIKSFK